MSQNAVEQLIGRLVTDDYFRQKLRRNARAACQENGFSLTEGELQLVQKIDLDLFTSLATLLSDGIRRSDAS